MTERSSDGTAEVIQKRERGGLVTKSLLDRCQYKRAVLSYVVDPGDSVALIMLDALGSEEFFSLVSAEEKLTYEIRRKINKHLTSSRQKSIEALNKSIEKWQRKYKLWNRDSYQRHLGSGGFLLIPEKPSWPSALNDLGINRPVAIWGKGREVIPPGDKVVAIVGSRQSSSYGQRVTAELSYELTESGYTIVSGGAFGIDACAHRSALAATGQPWQSKTIAVVAGGIDVYYPRQHERLYREVIEYGSYISEAAPETRATKWRFLQRNRLIAALAAVVCVTEARFRSGALSTAHHAFNLLRHVTTVPGNILLPNSGGCHQLIRKNMAVLVTCANDIKELIEPLTDRGADPSPCAAAVTLEAQRSDDFRNGEEIKLPLPGFQSYSAAEQRIIDVIVKKPGIALNAIIIETQLEPHDVLSNVASLRSHDIISEHGDGYKVKDI